MKRMLIFAAIVLVVTAPCFTQTTNQTLPVKETDLSKDPVLYTVGYAHLDTEWRWDYEETVNQFLKNTLELNFKMFEKYRNYSFTFSGARRYKMFREYYPEKYDTLKSYINRNRWFVGGSSVDECDVNVPSPESVIRQVLYGNQYFRKEFGKESVDFMLPDCFGFQAHLPSTLAHAGVKGFSTQKLSWGSANGIPFNIGNWIGPDGTGVIAALNATDYNGRVKPRFDTARYWIDRVMDNGKKYGIYADFRYYGVGDVGGAPREEDIRNASVSASARDGKIKILLSSSDQIFKDIKPSQAQSLPTYTGDLLLTEHSSGSVTSQAMMKRWNRKNEQLALSAEPAAVMAEWTGALPYPQKALNEAWWLVLGSQMHDILPGTCIPKAYEYAWNDEVLALNRFASQLKSSCGGVAGAMDTRGKGQCVVVYNPLAIARTDVVEATIPFPAGSPKSVVVVSPKNDTIPSQVIESGKNHLKIVFQATVPSFGFACYDVAPSEKSLKYQSDLSASGSILDNEFLKATINADGNISSLIDKKQGKELLSAPARLEFQKEHPAYWPAWNMDWKDRQKPPVEFVKGPATVTVLEKGPVRATVKIERKARNSVIIQTISLDKGSNQLVFRNHVEWQSKGVSLKAAFPLTSSSNLATYNLGLGTRERPTNEPKKYEVPSREWFDLTDKSGKSGVTVLEDCKFGSDKPDDHTLRLTLLYTPETNSFHDQASQDFGIHDFSYALYSHSGDWRSGLSEWQARRLNQPLVAFISPSHPGSLGKEFSFAKISSPKVDIRVIKKAENGKDIVIRLQELTGREAENVEISFASNILKAWETDGQERMIGEGVLKNGKLMVNFQPFGIRSFAVQLAPPPDRMLYPTSLELPLIFNEDVITHDANRKDGGFGSEKITIPAELFPETLSVDGVQFNLGPVADGKSNAIRCQGQKITLPSTGNYNYAYVLAAATVDTSGTFKVGTNKTTLRIQQWNKKIGQSDLRRWDGLERLKGLDKGYIRRDEVAWYSTHLHGDTANIPYQYGYIYLYRLNASPVSKTIELPVNEAIRIFAVSLSENPYDRLENVKPLYDDFSGRKTLELILPVSYVTDQMKPIADIEEHTHKNLGDLPARLTMKDFADMHQPNGTTARFYFTEADSNFKFTGPSGERITDGMNIPALTDGMFELLPSDSLTDRWSRTGEGRFLIDFQKEIEIDSLHLFVQQQLAIGSRSFSVWGTGNRNDPGVKGDPKSAGWNFIAYNPPEEIWGNNKGVFTLYPAKNQNLKFRYLMFVTETPLFSPYYFREADVFERQR